MSKMTRNEMTETLRKRKNHLMHRISESDKDLTYDRRECAALMWVLDLLDKEKLKENEHERSKPLT